MIISSNIAYYSIITSKWLKQLQFAGVEATTPLPPGSPGLSSFARLWTKHWRINIFNIWRCPYSGRLYDSHKNHPFIKRLSINSVVVIVYSKSKNRFIWVRSTHNVFHAEHAAHSILVWFDKYVSCDWITEFISLCFSRFPTKQWIFNRGRFEVPCTGCLIFGFITFWRIDYTWIYRYYQFWRINQILPALGAPCRSNNNTAPTRRVSRCHHGDGGDHIVSGSNWPPIYARGFSI